MKNVSKVRLSLRKFLIAAMAVGPLAVLPSPVWAALPTNASFQVTNGTVTAVQVNSTLVNINTTDKAVIVWGTGNFNIASTDTWNFNVPIGGAVLNKVGYTTIGLPAASPDNAVIDGTLLSSGRVFILANGNISVGAGAVINTTGGLVLSTLNDSEAAFLTTGNLLNTGNSLGNITLSNPLAVTGDLEATTGQFASNQVGGGTVAGNLVLRSITANQGVQLATGGVLTVTNSNLTVVTNNGAITQDANIVASNTSRTVSLSTGSTGTSGITLGNTTNDFGRVALTTNGSATVVDANALVLTGSTVGGALDIDAGGNISTNAAVVVGGNADYSTSSGSVTVGNNSSVGGNLTGSASGTNNFTYSGVGNLTTLAITGGNVSLTSNAAVRINGTITSGNNTTVTGTTINQTTGTIATTQALTYNATSGNVILGNIGADRITVTTNNSAISQASGTAIATANTSASGVNSFNAGTAALTLNSTTNEFNAGPRLNVTASTANIVTGNSVNVGTTNVTGGNYTLVTNETNANVVLGGAIIAGAPTINVSGVLNITTSGTGNITDNPYSAVNAQGGLSLTTSGGNVTLTAASVNAPLAPLVSYGRVDISGGNVVTVEETNTLNLGNVTANSLVARSINGDIVDSGDIVVSGATTFRVGAAASVQIDGEDNQFSTVNFVGGANNTFVSSSSVTIGNNTAVAGNLTVTTVDDANVTLESPAVSGMLAINADGTITIGGTAETVITGSLSLASNDTGASSITQSQTLRVTGNTTISSAGNVALGANNDFGTVIFTSTGGDATVADINNLSVWGNVGGVLTATSGSSNAVVSAYTLGLGNLVVGGLNLTANNGSGVSGDGPSGAISQIAGTSIGSVGAVAFNTVNAAVTVNNTGNSFGGVTVVAGNGTVNLQEDATLRLVNLTTTGNANLTSRFGSIVDSGSATVVGGNVLTLNAANGSVTLNPAGGGNGQFTSNTFVVNAPNGAVALRSNANAVALGNVSGISLTVNHTGTTNLSQTGRAQIFGTTNVSSGGNIILSNTANNFGRVQLTTSGASKNITITEAGTLNFGAVTMPAASSGNFTATSVSGDIIDSGLLGVRIGGTSASNGTGIVTLNATNGNIMLDDPTTDFFTSGGVTFTGNMVTFATLNNVVLGANNTTATANTLSVTSATGSISNGGNVIVTGDATFQTGNGNITLTQAGNRFGAVRFAGNIVRINQANDINLITGSTAIGNAEFTSGSYITIDNRGGIVTIGGTATFLAAGAITLPKLLQVANTVTVSSPATKDLSALSLVGDLAGITPVNLGTGAYLPPAP